MNSKLIKLNQEANFARYVPMQKKGHYESYFLRANHPTKPIAFWIRYTIFSPNKNPDKAIGELWAIFFNGETGVHTAVKDEVSISESSFASNRFDVKIILQVRTFIDILRAASFFIVYKVEANAAGIAVCTNQVWAFE